jgi:TP901 family phage tail tape measure protein
MADEVINKLGFNVDEALEALQRLDTALQGAGSAFSKFGTTLDSFNDRASAALATMRSLASAASRLSTSMQSAPASTGATATTAPATKLWLPSGVESSASQAAQAMAAVGTAAQQAGQKAAAGMNNAANATAGVKKHADSLIVSWNTIARVVMTQTIVRAMSMIRDALKDAVTTAEDFQVHLAEIRSIAPRIGADLAKGVAGAGESLKSFQIEVTEFSKRANLPLPQVTEGLYQTISDQFTSVTDRSNVMNAAMKLSKVGVMDFQDAITLLTGTLNAYGKGSAEAESSAAKFFETIRLGHVRGKELADTMGQAIPIAAELGVGLDELNAAMVTMTIGGMDAHKSVTALRGVMTAFLKPSEDMKKVMREMGFSDPAQLIAAKGFEGALKAIAEQADGMGSEIAKSVRNVRALTAELRLTSEGGAQQYEQALKAMRTATPENLEQILKEFRSTDAERLTSQINALKVNLTQDFGQAIVGVLANMMEMMGGADKMASAITAIAAAAIPCAVALAGLAAAFALVHISLGPIGIAMLALTAGLSLAVGTYTYVTMSNIANIRQEADARRQLTLQVLREEDQKIAKWKETAEAQNKTRLSSLQTDLASLRRDYFRAMDDLKVKNNEAINGARQTMESMIQAQERVIAVYRNAANAAVRAVQESQQRQKTLLADYADTRFKYAQQGLDAEQKAENYRLRALQQARVAAKELANAKSPDEIQSALAAYQRAEAQIQEAENIAKSTNNIVLQQDAERAVLTIMLQKVDAEKKLQQVQAKQAADLAKKAAAEQARTNEMKSLMPQILKDLQAFDKQGPKDDKSLAEQEARLKANVARFGQLFLGGQKVDISDLLSFDQLQRRVTVALEGGVDQVKINKFLADPGGFSDLRQQIKDGVGPVEIFIKAAVKYDPALKQELKGMTSGEAMDHIANKATQAAQRTVDFTIAEQNLDAAEKGLKNLAANAAKSLQQWAQKTGDMDIGITDAFQLLLAPDSQWSKGVKAATTEFKKQSAKFTRKGANVTDKDFKELEDAYTRYTELVKPSAESKEAYEQFVKDAKSVLEQSQKVKAAKTLVDGARSNATEAGQRLPDIEAAMKAAKEAAEQTKQSTDGANQGAQVTKSALGEVASLDMSGLTSQISNAAIAMWDLASASMSVQAPSYGATARFGGEMQRYADGGSVGTDVIPALLSPGEFVMTSTATRKFASQLSAMNAGIQPIFRNEGGSVTNIGDVAINIDGSKSPELTGRAVHSALKRFTRRGA